MRRNGFGSSSCRVCSLSTLELDMLGLSIAALLSTIDQKRVHLVDSYPRDQPHNFIFRGNNPMQSSRGR